MSKQIYPTIKELTGIIMFLKCNITDDCIAEDETVPSIAITIGYSLDSTWGYQSGDNSFFGSAYGHNVWAIDTIYRRSNSRTIAKNLLAQIKDDIAEFAYCNNIKISA